MNNNHPLAGKVSKLVWQRADEDDGIPQWRSGQYFVQYTFRGYRLYIGAVSENIFYQDDEVVKEVAQQHFENYILSAIPAEHVNETGIDALDVLEQWVIARENLRKFENDNPNDSTKVWEKLFKEVEYAEQAAQSIVKNRNKDIDSVIKTRRKSLAWIIENTTQVRVRDLATDILNSIEGI